MFRPFSWKLLTLALMCSIHFSHALGLLANPTDPVQTTGGLVRGTVSKDSSFAEFHNIPYATTSAATRYAAATPNPQWDGILEATDKHVACIEKFPRTNLPVGQEDCLTLSVFVPFQHDQEYLPVMVFIHGGGFKEGSNTDFLYGPDYLVHKGVILVTINYRLASFGFLCLGIPEAPGNVGMKDQVEALRWVKRNIKAFGGDPDNVTVFGESAGSASVSYHLVSPMSAGLFKRAIMESGSSMSPWTLQYEPVKIASAYAHQLGFNSEDPYEIYNFLMSQPADELALASIPRPFGDQVSVENWFVPCTEKPLPGIEPFLTDNPYNLYASGKYNKVPVIQGYNSEEGYRYVGKESKQDLENMNFYSATPHDLYIPTEQERVQVADNLNQVYMQYKPIPENVLQFSKYEGDNSIIFPALTNIDLMVKSGGHPVYAYMFAYSGKLNLVKKLYGFSKAPGATHGDELFYLFKSAVSGLVENSEREKIDQMTTMWTNFAKYSNPTPEQNSLLPLRWEPASDNPQNPQFFVIDRQFSYEPLVTNPRIQYLIELYHQYRKTSGSIY